MAESKKHILVSGRVQGVGFRNYVLTSALVAGVSGWVRNLSDGRVEAIALGEEESMTTFLQQLRKGPPAAKVAKVEVRDVESPLTYQNFLIESTGEQPWQEHSQAR